MFGLEYPTIIPIIISMIAIGVTIYMWYQLQTTSMDVCPDCIQKYDYLIDKLTNPTTPAYYKLFIDPGTGKPKIEPEQKSDDGTTIIKPAMVGVTAFAAVPPETYIANLKNVYQEKYSKCGGINCNSRKNEWSGMAGKTCTDPNCTEHFDPKNYGLYNDEGIHHIKPENYKGPSASTHGGTGEHYTEIGSNGIPRVDMKDKLREGAPILRGDSSIVPSNNAIVGRSRLRHESLTPGLFY